MSSADSSMQLTSATAAPYFSSSARPSRCASSEWGCVLLTRMMNGLPLFCISSRISASAAA